jgi:hypothetical protein
MHIFIKDDRTNQNYLLNNQIIDDYFKNNNILNKIYKNNLYYGEIFLININITIDNVVIFHYFFKYNPNKNGSSFRFINNLNDINDSNKEIFVLNLFDEFYFNQYDFKYTYVIQNKESESNYLEIKEKYPEYFLDYEWNNFYLIRFSDEIKIESSHFLQKSDLSKIKNTNEISETFEITDIEFKNFTINDTIKLQINEFIKKIDFDKYIKFSPKHISLILDKKKNILFLRLQFFINLYIIFLPIINDNFLETIQNFFNNYDNSKFLTVDKNIFETIDNEFILDKTELEAENKVIIKIPNDIIFSSKTIYSLK